jgi:nanoRNase/pAp phosphatase (c-di-AMP/oligoRNAs hydrolase)
MELGGGGHDYAAGFALTAPLGKTVDAVVKRLDTLVQNFEKFGK